MSSSTFIIYEVHRDQVYDYISPSLIKEELHGTWLTESKKPILFCCVNCKQTKIDLSNHDLRVKEWPRTSIEKIKHKAIKSCLPWIIKCTNCQSIYEITNGWVEPNNGRMITTLTGVYEIEESTGINKIASVVLPKYQKVEVKNYATNFFKYYLQLNMNLTKFQVSLTIEQVIGKLNNRRELQIEFFGMNNSGLENLGKILEESTTNAIQELHQGSVKLKTNFGIKITNLIVSETGEKIFKESNNDDIRNIEKEILSLFQKLVVAIVRSDDEQELIKNLSSSGFKVKNLIEN